MGASPVPGAGCLVDTVGLLATSPFPELSLPLEYVNATPLSALPVEGRRTQTKHGQDEAWATVSAFFTSIGRREGTPSISSQRTLLHISAELIFGGLW